MQDVVCRNVYYEKSKADDVQFILDLIAKVGAEIPQADMNNVNIAGDLVTAAAAWVWHGWSLSLICRQQQRCSPHLPAHDQHWSGQTLQKVG